MKLKDITNESKVTYQTLPTIRFRIPDDISFEELKNHPDVIKRMGPHTVVFDVSDVDVVRTAPGENKWNAMRELYGRDDDEIVCGRNKGGDWICLAINVMV